MSKERENKNIAARWLEGFWGASWSPTIVDYLAADDIILQFSLQSPRCGRDEAKKFLAEIHEKQSAEHRAAARRGDGERLSSPPF
jgi:hypothetical protein